MAGNRSDVHKRTPCFDEKRCERLGDGQWPPDIDFENPLRSVDILVQERHEMVASSVVNQVRQRAACLRRDSILRCPNLSLIGHFECQQSDIGKAPQSTRFVQVAGCGEDVVAALLEDEGQAGADATVTAAGDKDRFLWIHFLRLRGSWRKRRWTGWWIEVGLIGSSDQREHPFYLK